MRQKHSQIAYQKIRTRLVTAEYVSALIIPPLCYWMPGRTSRHPVANSTQDVILPIARASNAVELAERLRQKVEETMLIEPDLRKEQPAIYVTVSIGVAGYRFSGDLDTARGVVERADKALYEAKNQGRNRVISSNDLDDLT